MSAKVSMNQLDAFIQERLPTELSSISCSAGGKEISIEVKRTIPIEEMTELVYGVVGNLLVDNGGEEPVYCPERYDLALAANILKHYTNLKDDLGNTRLVALVYGTDLMNEIVKRISDTQYRAMIRAIDRQVAFMTASMHAAQEARLAEMASKIDRAAAVFQSLIEQFSSIGDDKMQKIFDNLSQMGPDELVEAVARTAESK